MRLKITTSEGGAAFVVQVMPRASRDEVVGVQGEAIKIRLTAPPVEGAANAALIEFLAAKLGVPKGSVEIVAGARSRRKLVAVSGILPAQVEARLLSQGCQEGSCCKAAESEQTVGKQFGF